MTSKPYDKILSYIPLIKNDSIGEWFIDDENDGTPERPLHLPFAIYSENVQGLEDAVYEFVDWNPDMELNRYNDILIENGIEWESESMKAADVSKLDVRTVMALLVGAFRAERFCEGALMDFFKSGAILRWLERLQEIVLE